MTLKNHGPGGCCCDPCTSLDTFTSEVEVTAANTTTIRSTQHPQSPYPLWLQVEVKGSADTAIPLIFFAWDDSSPGDGLYLQIELETPISTAGTIGLYRKDGTQVGESHYIDGLVSAEWHTVTVCLDPDEDPDKTVVCIDPAGAYPSQCANFELPTGFAIGRKAGYGTASGHSGTAYFRNYKFDRLWYCGDGTEDCHENLDDFDYYNDTLPRTYCHGCTDCPAGARPGTAANWQAVSGSWTHTATSPYTTAYTTASDARLVAYPGQADWQMGAFNVTLESGAVAIFGWSDAISRNQVYVQFSHNAGTSKTISVGTFYDEKYDRFYFWFSVVGTYAITYSVYMVTNSGAPSLASGPTTLSSALVNGAYVIIGDDYTTLHAPMRKAFLGTGTITGTVLFSGFFNQCSCSGTVPATARKFTGTVAGVGAGSAVCTYLGTPQYFDHTLLNRGGTLRNYYQVTPAAPFASPCVHCCHSNWENVYSGGGALLGTVTTWFYASYVGDYTELHGYAYADYLMTNCGYRAVQVHFFRQIWGHVDLRALSGEVLPYADTTYSSGSGWIDASSATFTVSATP